MKPGPLRLVTLNSTVQFNMHYFLSKAGIKQKKNLLSISMSQRCTCNHLVNMACYFVK